MSLVAQRPFLRHRGMPVISKTGWRTLLLVCGIAAPLLYFGMDLLAAMFYDGYSYKSQTISELSAVGAPTRPLWLALGTVYALLMVAFGAGVFASAGGQRSLRIVGGAAAAVGVIGLVAWPFAPMHQREVLAAGGGTFSDTLHIILSAIDGVLFFIAAAFAAMALGKKFRIYTIVTILIAVVAATLMNLESPNVADNEPTPWIGVTERILVFGSMLWYAVLAIVLIRRDSTVGG